MRNLDAFYQRVAPYVLSIFRIMVGALFMEHGTQKILGFPASPEMRIPPLYSLGWVAGMMELVGGGLVVLGLGTRLTSFLLSGMMAVAYFLAHAARGFFPALNGGELAVLYCFAFLYLAVAGGGPISLDALLCRNGVRSRRETDAPG